MRLAYDTGTSSSRPNSRPPSRATASRPPSPVKSHASPVPSNPRPKAKVNSSVTPALARRLPAATHVPLSKSISSPNAVASASTTPRAASPAKQPPRVREGTLSSTFQPKAGTSAKPTLRPATPRATPAPPELRHRSLTSASSDAGRYIPDKRSRSDSVSLHHAISFSSLQGSNSSSVGSYSPPLTPTDPLTYSDHERCHSPSIRIKSKVTGIAKATGNSLSPPSAFPSHPTRRIANNRARTPSVSSNTSLPPSPPSQHPVFYPITTATPAANPHRFAATRPVSRQPIYHPQPFHPLHDDVHVDYGRRNGFAKVDPANIPLPANSPPASAVSFSSHSSVSRSSVSHAAESVESHTHTDQTRDIEQLRSTLDTLIRYTELESREDDFPDQDRETESQIVSSDRTVEAEAKSIRKVSMLSLHPGKFI